jgi:hypothetical protein
MSAPRHAKDREMPSRQPTLARCRRHVPSRLLLLTCCLALPAQTGCMRVMAITGKVLFGDPVTTSTFEQYTTVRLADGHTVGLICTAPLSVVDEFDGVHLDVQEEVIRRMRVHGLDVLHSDRLIDAMDSAGGGFKEQAIAAAVPEMDYLLHIELTQFTIHEELSPTLYRGRARGTVAGYQVHRSEKTGAVETIPVFDQDFSIEYPSSHPVATDQMSQSAFVSRCVDEISDQIGRMFYDVPTADLF